MRSDVNQAYLRAYVKNRAANAASGPTVPESIAPGGIPLPTDNGSGSARRLDPAVRQTPAPKSTVSEYTNPPATLRKNVPMVSSPVPLTPNAGVWSPLGAERGMKGVGTHSARPPAVTAPIQPSSHTDHDDPIDAPLDAVSPSYSPSSEITTADYSHSAVPSRSVPTMRVDPSHSNARSHASQQAASPVLRDRNSTQHNQTGADSTQSRSIQEPNPQTRTGSPVMPIAPSTEGRSTQPMPLDGYRIHRPGVEAIPDQPLPSSFAPVDTKRVSSAPKPHLHLSGTKSSTAHNPKADSKLDETRTHHGNTTNATALPRETPLPMSVAFFPSWEVDQFFWPEVVLHIQRAHSDAFDQIGKHLRLANQDGLKVMAITSGERGVGRSTVAMHMARCAASAGLNVALVDADTFYPSIIDQLRLDMEHGWQDCLFENVPLEEVAVKSIQDNITIFPLSSVISQQQLHVNLHRMAKIIKRISTAFDIVFLDSNRLNLEQRDLIGVAQESIVDAAIMVVDTELSMKEKVDTGISILQGMGIASIGIVENFHG